MQQQLRTLLIVSATCLLAAAEARALSTITETAIEDGPTVVMENGFVRAVFRPEKGGMCTQFLCKTSGKRFVAPYTGSLLGTRVWNYTDRELYFQWERMPWSHEALRRAGEVELVMRAPGTVDFTRATTFEKRLVLRDDEAMLRVMYTFSVGQQLVNPPKIGLWFRNTTTVVGERTVYRFPLDDGILTLDPAGGTASSFLYNPTRGWAAAAGENEAGLCFMMEYRRLMAFHQHVRKEVTVEWAFRTMAIKNGDSFSTRQLLVPFAGIESVQGGGGGVVAGFSGPETYTVDQARAGIALHAQLNAGMPQDGELVVSTRRLPKGEDTPVCRRRLALKPGTLAETDVELVLPEGGTWFVQGEWLRDGRVVMDFVKPLTIGEASGSVRLAPKERRLGRVSERFEDRVPLAGGAPKDLKLSTEVESPHIKWAKPHCGGRLRVLVLTSPHTGREAVELAQRLDMEILWVTAGTEYELNGISNWFPSRYQVAHMNQNIKQELLHPCDAIIIAGLRGSLFTDEVLDLFRRKVEEGAGLIYIGPTKGADKLYEFLPVEREKRIRCRAEPWKAVGSHAITTGVPLDRLPSTAYTRYEATGKVLAAIGKHPLVVAQTGPGKGRVVVFTYNTDAYGAGSYAYGLTPFVEDSDCRFEYWEYHFSLLIKALLWSTQWESPIRLEAIEAELVAGRPEAALTLENSGAAGAARAEISLADACGTLEFEGSTEVSLAPGLQEIRLKLSADDVSLPLPGGAHLANVILRDAAGRVLTWGSVTLRVPEAVRIERIAFDRRAYSPGDVAKATVQIAGVEGPIPPVILRAEFIDALGRLLVTREHQTESGEGGTIPFELPVGQPLSTVATLRVTALSQGRPIAVSEADVITFPEKFARRAWADFEATVCGNHAGKYGRDYLIPLRSRLLKEYGVTTVRAGVRWRTDREYARQIRAGFQIMPLGVGYGSINIGHRVPKGKMSFKEQRANYDKTHDKAYLVRPVCLNSESDLAGNAARLREIAEYCAWLKPIGYNVGDEMSTTHYVTAFDYDFGAEALAAFRVWLREQYGSLAALNDQWDTAFAAWDDVMPLTTFEVKGRGNYAPWADHRAFMDYSFSAFLSWTRDRLRERDPEAALGISGSQAAEAYGGYDWSQLGRSLDFAVNYTHQNTIIMQRSLTPNVAWATPYWHVRNPATRHHFWWRLLNGCFGSSHFTYRFMFYPDLTPMPSTAEAAAVVQEFQSGVAKLLKNCTRISDIGIHYSQASIRGAFISGASSLFRENRMGWVQALEDSGFQGEFLAREQLESGELSARGYQAFVLPFSVAMSAKEGRALRRYVEDGGLLIADGKTGLMDERCKTRERGLLDDVFGIGRPEVDPLVAPREGEARFERNHGACELRDLGLDLSVAEQALTLAAGGEALGTHGKAPLAVVKKVGKGTAVFLNFFLDSLPHRRKLGMGKPMRELARNILLLDGVEPAIRVDVEADPPPHMFTVSYTSGAALYVASLMSHEGKTAGWTAPVSLTFPKAGYVYDIRGGLALGRVEGARLNLLAGEPALYGILPYRVSAVSVAPLTGVVTRGEPVRYEVAIQADAQQAGMHVIQAEVVDPGGVVRAHYSTRLLTRGGMATGEFVPALNDPTGLWTIRATDYVTRATGSAQLELRP